MSVPAERFDEAITRSDLYDDGAFALDELPPETDVEEVQLDEGDEGEQADEGRLPPLDVEALKSVVDHEIEQALGGYESELSENRIAAYRYYDGNLRRAPAGRSNATSTDVADVLEWTMPQVMSALFNTENVVSFDPVGEDDEEQAQLETDACEHVLMRENKGWLMLQTAIRDALLLRNGVLKVYHSDRQTVSLESYEGLTEAELAEAVEAEDETTEIEVLGHEVREGPPAIEAMDPAQAMQMQQAAQQGDQQAAMALQQAQAPQPVYDVKLRVRRAKGGTVVRPVPLDEFMVNREHDGLDLQEARFVAEHRLVPRYQLVEEGFDYDAVMDLPPWNDAAEGERQERRRYEDEQGFNSEHLDESMQLVRHFECYIMIDADRDGFAERLKVDLGGNEGNTTLLGIEETDHVPFVGGTGILQPHKWVGRSLFDRVWEIADQKTQVLRSVQDNLAHQNNARVAVVVGQVNMDDMLTNRPGGIVRVKAPGMIEPLVAPQIGEWGYKHLDWLDNVRTGRSGVSPDTAGVAEAIAGDTAHGLERIMSAKEELTGLIIKMLAETLLGGTMQLIRLNLQKYRTSALHFKKRGKWAEVDPRDWKQRSGVVVDAHLSQGDKGKRAMALQTLIEQQRLVVEAGGMGTLVSEANIHNALQAFARATPIGDPSLYWTDPESDEANQAREQARQQAEAQKQAEAAAQDKLLALQQELQTMQEETKRMKLAVDATAKDADRVAEVESKLADLAAKYTEMELKYSTDVPGEGMEDGEPSRTFPESWDITEL